jgi:glycosyltransferase involved in cell wall biosynthesis
MKGVTRHRKFARQIGLNAHLLSVTQSYRSAGINGYIQALLKHLPGAGADLPELSFTAYLRDPGYRPPEGLQVARSGWDTSNPWRRILWEQTALAAVSRDLDVLHGLAYIAPLAAACPTVITVHDLSFLRFPDAFRRFNRTYLSLFTRLSVRKAACVIADSESTRRDVIELCGVPSERVVTVYIGVSEAFTPAPAEDVAEFRRRRGLPERFILFLGTLEPRKNLSRLIEAYAVLRRNQGAGAPRLVIAGGKGWFYENLFSLVTELDLEDAVLFPGYVPAAELPWWYRAAEIFVYPSLFEGFGLPVVEAMRCGTPTITSSASSLPEVAGSAALLVHPDDTEGLVSAMERILGSADLRQTLVQAGLLQAAQFSWSRTAAETAGIYRAILNKGPGASHAA